jgi:GNAT superfamily N-acetyltransferase
MTLERKAVDEDGSLYRLPGDNPDELSSVMAAHLTSGEYLAYFHRDLRESLLSRLRALTAQQIYTDESAVLAILGIAGPAWRGRTSVFTRSYDPNECPLVAPHRDRFVVEVAGVVAAEAWSSRSTDRAAELAVETRPEFQRRGYGRQVCAAWANEQRSAGRIAFYSHSVENSASAALARSLGVQHFMDNANYG